MVNKREINKILQEMKIPEPDESTKKTTIKAVMDEFHKQKLSYQKNLKGTETERRLTGRIHIFLNLLGGFAMKRSFVIASGATAFVAILVVGLTYLSVKLNEVPQAVNVPTEPAVGIESGGPQKRKMETANQYAMSKRSTSGGSYGVSSSTGREQAQVRQRAYEQEQSYSVQGGNGSTAYNYDLEGSRNSMPSYPPPSPSWDAGSGASYNNNMQGGRSAAYKHTLKGFRNSMLSNNLPSVYSDSRHMLAGVPGTYNSISSEPEGHRQYKEKGRDQFDTINTNPVKQVKEEPVSTFSIDVDTASYAFVRRQINHGVLPQENAVRIEELINYFDYDYIVPEDRTRPFQPTIAIYPTPWNPDSKLLHIGIKGYDIVPEEKPRSNLVFLIDVSGSMDEQDKLPLIKNSFRLLVNSLDEEDTVAIVVYAGAAGTVLEPTSVKEKGRILSALDQMQAGGSTAGGEGIRKAYDLAEANFKKDGVNRIILATDGDFNVGIYDTEELKSFIDRKRKSGIFLSVLGFGQGNYNDALMQKLAQNGNGNASYIDNLNEARKVLVDEASSTLFTIARDVKIQIEFNPELITEYRLIGYESRMLKREDFNNDKVDAGDIGSGHSVTAIYEIIPVGSKGRLVDDLRYGRKENQITESELSDSEYAFLKIRYKLPDSEKSELITTPINKENEYVQLDQVPADIRFATSVAAFGQILRGGIYTAEFTYEDVIKLAESTVSKDKFGYRQEFLNLVRLAKVIE
ncbi:MAG: vWA domain-containing protein [Candidatus Scalindua sp.]